MHRLLSMITINVIKLKYAVNKTIIFSQNVLLSGFKQIVKFKNFVNSILNKYFSIFISSNKQT